LKKKVCYTGSVQYGNLRKFEKSIDKRDEQVYGNPHTRGETSCIEAAGVDGTVSIE